MQEMMDVSLIEVCAEEGVSTEQVLFYFAVVFIITAAQEKNVSKSVEEITNS